MREFAPKKSHPSDAELAAYIDGALDETEAERVAVHLADCGDCYFVYSETLQFQLDSEPAIPGGEVIRFPLKERPRVPWWVAVAAAAVLVMGAGVWYAYQAVLLDPPQLTVAEIAPDLRERPIQGILWEHNVFRGNGNSEPELARQSFQVGALLVDFHLSARAGAAEQASNVWRTIGGVVDETGYGYMKELSERIFSEANRIDPEHNPVDASKSLQTVAAQLARTEGELRDDSSLFPEYIDFGKWTEAGRIAAQTEDSEFFENGQNRRFLSYSLKGWKPEKPEEVRSQLEKIERIWDQGELDSQDFKALAGHFQAILDQYEFLA
jgi:hypothetical protein